MSVHMNIQELELLYQNIHRLAKERVHGATYEQVRQALKTFHDGSATRLDFAFKIYWQLQEKQNFYPASSFIEDLEELQGITRNSLKDYWTVKEQSHEQTTR